MSNLSAGAMELNSSIWRNIYSEGKGDLRYPNDVLVRVGARLFGENQNRRILDFGFGTGANFLHFASRGFEMHGVEISERALARTKEKLEASGYPGDLRLIQAGERLPYADSHFQIVYAWQVLYYNDRDGWTSVIRELERVTETGGLVVVATAAPGDVSQVEAEPLGNHMYRSEVPGQKGCILTIPDRSALSEFFPGQTLEIGEFGFRFGDATTRHWIVCYRKANL
jgi:SAM-dependent methyltransferase